MRSIDEFKKAAKENTIDYWCIRSCSMCDYELGYHLMEELVYFDSGCNCTSSRNMVPSSWDALAEFYNAQQHPSVIKNFNQFWGFNNV